MSAIAFNPDSLPGTYETRVFIGGSYEFPATLRRIREIVDELGFHSVLPLDDFRFPSSEVHDWSLRILHMCRHAIFEVTRPAGELMEIQRARDYKTHTLLLWQMGDTSQLRAEALVGKRAMLTQSGPHETRGYGSADELSHVITLFLTEKRPGLFASATETFGFRYERVTQKVMLKADRDVDFLRSYSGLRPEPGRRIFEIFHAFWFQPGVVMSFEPQLLKPGTWQMHLPMCTDSARAGVLKFPEGRDDSAEPYSYGFLLKVRDGFARTVEELPKIDDPMVAGGYDYYSVEIVYPFEELVFEVSWEPQLDIRPGAVSYQSSERREEGIRCPPDSFNVEDDRATLTVRRPLMNHTYMVYWPLAH